MPEDTARVAAAEVTVGELVAAFLEGCGVPVAFGVISIHNMPILDAIGRRGAIRFVPARGEAGAAAMADAEARVRGGLGVVVTSTGTAAGNAAGAMVEAQTAGTPLLHLTGQIELPYLDRGRGYIHEAADQPTMLRGVSKAVFRIWSPETALGSLREAVRTALTAPAGPVSVEIPIDVQEARIALPAALTPVAPAVQAPDEGAVDALADALAAARRPLLWLGGGARGAGAAAARLAALGFGIVTSAQGRGVVAEDHPMSLGAFGMSPAVEAFYGRCDALLVAGSRLRSNETLKYALKLPRPLYQIDADPRQESRAYPAQRFVCGDAAIALNALADRLDGRLAVDPGFAAEVQAARVAAEEGMRAGLGPYAALVAALQGALPRDFVWVRDVTVSNSTWGNRLLRIGGPRDGVHALGGGIGLGLPMGIGAALAARGRPTVALIGDGGFAMNIGELSTAVQEGIDLLILLMNDRGYGVIRNIQDARFGGRRYYADLTTPDFALLSQAMGLRHWRIASTAAFGPVLGEALAARGPRIVEVDMTAIGPFAAAFAGPPVRKAPG